VHGSVFAGHTGTLQVLGHPVADGGLWQRHLTDMVPLCGCLLVLHTPDTVTHREGRTGEWWLDEWVIWVEGGGGQKQISVV